MDWKELKTLALASGEWRRRRAFDDGGTWIFPDGTELAKSKDAGDLHHGQIARSVGLTLEKLDPYYGEHMGSENSQYDESNDRYWQAVNTLCRHFGMIRMGWDNSFQVWDQSAFPVIQRNMRRTKRTGNRFVIDLISNGMQYCFDPLEDIGKIKVENARRSEPCSTFYLRGFHPKIELILSGKAPIPTSIPSAICTELSLSAIL